MKNIKFTYKKEPQYEVVMDEVIKILDDKPHLLMRVTINGGYFAHRAPEPVVRIMRTENDFSVSWFAVISEDQRAMHGYFPVDIKLSDWVEYGYGNEIHRKLNFDIKRNRSKPLDRKRIEVKYIEVTQEYLNKILDGYSG